jgi:uncharacterized membrane protein
MSYNERRVVAALVSTILISALYFVYVFQRFPAGNAYSPEVFHFWGLSILILLPVSTAANIAVQIASSIGVSMTTNEKQARFSDERDRLIELRATRNALYVFTLGFVLAMGSLVIDQPPSVMFIVLIAFGFMAGMIGYISQLYFYRKGF